MTREPDARRARSFALIRSAASCVWAVHVDVAAPLARELDALASDEPCDPWNEPRHAARYRELLAGETHDAGPCFEFPAALADGDVAIVDDERALNVHFRGWIPGEIAAGRAPVMAIVVDGAPVSACFCARRSEVSAAAGVETAPAFRGRGLAPRVVAAWARAIRASGLEPHYSTSWSNAASRAVARKLGLVAVASTWTSAPG